MGNGSANSATMASLSAKPDFDAVDKVSFSNVIGWPERWLRTPKIGSRAENLHILYTVYLNDTIALEIETQRSVGHFQQRRYRFSG